MRIVKAQVAGTLMRRNRGGRVPAARCGGDLFFIAPELAELMEITLRGCVCVIAWCKLPMWVCVWVSRVRVTLTPFALFNAA